VAGVTTIPADRLRTLLGDLRGERPPLYAGLAARLRLLVGDGRLPVGARLPAERDLAAALHLSRATVAAAYGRLREQGWADARQGSGTWTRLPASHRDSPAAWLPAPVAPGVVDLAHAAPSAPPQVPAAFAAALDDLPRLLPGHGYQPRGLPELRALVAERYTRRGLPTTAEQVLVTSGALHAVGVALETLTRRGDRVLVEHPTYPNALDAVRAGGRRPVPVAVDPDDPGATVRALTRAATATRPAMAYVMPDFQNPTGLLLDDLHRRRLAVGLRQAGTVALVDETMADLALDSLDSLDSLGAAGAAAPAPFAAVAADLGPGSDAAQVVTAGSLSKSVWGGLRIGWLRADAGLVPRLARVLGQGQLAGPVLEQLAACHLLEREQEIVAVRRAELRRRRDVLTAALAEHLPDWEVPLPAGGLVLWCRLPGRSSTALVGAAAERGVLLAPGPRFGTGAAFDDRLRLPFTQPEDVLAPAVAVLAQAAADVPHRPAPDSGQALVV
jgi:DNA-binding transcriptional MocR family regulator